MNKSSLLAKAFAFAAEKHCDQRRKGERAEPYINHLAEVADILGRYTRCKSVDLMIAGILHDTIEDAEVKSYELRAIFGKRVARLVVEVTDNKSLPKEERKRLQVINAPHKSAGAKKLKIADKSSNLRALVQSPPADWEQERIREYFIWAKQVVDGCRGVNKRLEANFDRVYAKGAKKYGITA